MVPLRLFILMALLLGSLALATPHSHKHHHHHSQEEEPVHPQVIPASRISGTSHDENNARVMGVGPEVKDPQTERVESVDNPSTSDGDGDRRSLNRKRFAHHGPHQKAMMSSVMRLKSRAPLVPWAQGGAGQWPVELGGTSKSKKKPDGGNGSNGQPKPGKTTPSTKPDKTTPTTPTTPTKPDKDQPTSSDDPSTTTPTTTTNTTTSNTTTTAKGSGTTTGASSGCTFSDYSSFMSGKGKCSKIVISDMKVPAGKTLDLSMLADGTEVVFDGTTTFGYQQWEGPLIKLWHASNLKVSGTSGSIIDGGGSKYWDGKGGHGGQKKPRFFAIDNLISSTISGLTLKNAPQQGFGVGTSTGLLMDGNLVDNTDGIKGGGWNQDGFDVSHCKQCTLSNNKVISTDDCVAVNSGETVKVLSNTCIGTHGVAVAPLAGATLDGALFQGNRLSGSLYGLRMKAVAGESATVSNVRFVNNVFENVVHSGIEVSQSYSNDHKYAEGEAGDKAPFTGVVFSGNHGTVSSGGSKMEVNCGASSCNDFTWEDNEITGGGQPSVCKNAPKAIPCGRI